MGLESLSMTARGMELGQAAHRFFSPLYLVAMAVGCYRPKTEDEKLHVPMCVRMCLSDCL